MLTTTAQAELTRQASTALLADWYTALDLRVRSGELAATSASAYKRGMQKFTAWTQSSGAATVDAETLRGWKADLLEAGRKPATVNAWLAGVKALFAWAVETGRLANNPAANVKGATRKGTAKKHSREALTDQEIRRVLALPDQSAQGKRDKAILYLMAYTGVRQVEVHRADLADLRTEGGRLVLYVQGKGHQEKEDFVVLANPTAQDAIYDWLAIRGSKAGALFTSLSRRSMGQRLELRSIRMIVKGYFRLAGVCGNKTTHSLRHTAISKAIQKGAPVQKVKSFARHENIETTMIYYHEADRLSNPAEEFIDYD